MGKHLGPDGDHLDFDLKLTVDATRFGLPGGLWIPRGRQNSSSEVMHIGTLFPTETTFEGIRGGLVLVHMRKSALLWGLTPLNSM